MNLKKEIEDTFNRELNDFANELSVMYLSNYIAMWYLMNKLRPYSKSIYAHVRNVYDMYVEIEIEDDCQKKFCNRNSVHDYNWLTGIKITDGHYEHGKWIFVSTKPELVTYILTHFRSCKITFIQRKQKLSC